MSLRSISPLEARRLLDAGAQLVDIREPDEYARERIPLAKSHPVSSLQAASLQPGASQVIFHCRSGARTQANAARLAQASPCDAYMIEGGLEAWKQAGLPVQKDASQPLEIMRQVQIAAGGLVVLGAVLGATVTPWFHVLAGLVGAGLIFAGVTGFCGMAKLLQVMPWNRQAAG